MGNVISAARRPNWLVQDDRSLLRYFENCMRALEVREDEIDDFALVLQPPRCSWFPELSLARLVRGVLAGPGGCEDDTLRSAGPGLYDNLISMQKVFYEVYTVLRLRVATADGAERTIFGMTWVNGVIGCVS